MFEQNGVTRQLGIEATSSLKLGNEFVEFQARFGGTAREIVVPVDHVVAIYARENGQGMAFPVPVDAAAASSKGSKSAKGEPAAEGAEGRPPTPLRGLRLASTEPPTAAAGEEDPPPDPPADAPGGSRPSLKRIK